ncbi:Putative bifunctional amine oxidase [Cladobotryum mycophilum]|uniref:Bifunctional amine oxidase n=1 Tax=Cladobotryum mycophilum TaxID=491253 RepID=A0ABR0SXP9_9HYPO
MASTDLFDVVVVGGGPIGLATAYEVAKAGSKAVVLEQNNFFNQSGSSGDLARMFRTMYTEDFMADLAKEAMDLWDDLEKDAGTALRWMSGLLNFGDKDLGEHTPEGTLLGPIPNLQRLNMTYQELTAKEIEERYPFKNLNSEWLGLFAPDNGVINVQLLLRTLLSLAKAYGAEARQHTRVEAIHLSQDDKSIWEVHTKHHETESIVYRTKKIVIASGAFANHVLKPSFGISLDLDIWEMVACYFNCNAGPGGTIFPSYVHPRRHVVPVRARQGRPVPALLRVSHAALGPPNLARIAVDAATRRIKDPSERLTNVLNPEDIKNVQDFVRDHVAGLDSTVPAYTTSCLQTNVFDNMFVLDFVPEKYLHGGPKDSVVVFTAGWAMKFVPMLGKALAELALTGKSKYALEEFAITRKDPITGKGIIVDGEARHSENVSSFAFKQQGSGSSIRGLHNTGS